MGIEVIKLIPTKLKMGQIWNNPGQIGYTTNTGRKSPISLGRSPGPYQIVSCYHIFPLVQKGVGESPHSHCGGVPFIYTIILIVSTEMIGIKWKTVGDLSHPFSSLLLELVSQSCLFQNLKSFLSLRCLVKLTPFLEHMSERLVEKTLMLNESRVISNQDQKTS